jgi:hypothetical protein
MKFWAYRHIDGGIHVKSYWEVGSDGIDPSLEEAYSSPFVDEVMDAFEANSRKDAERIASDKLKRGSISKRQNRRKAMNEVE